MQPFLFKHMIIHIYTHYVKASEMGSFKWTITYPHSKNPDKIRHCQSKEEGFYLLEEALADLFHKLEELTHAVDPSHITPA